MTREEAIEVLGVIKEVTVWKDRKEALGMAISALQEPSRLTISKEEAEKLMIKPQEPNFIPQTKDCTDFLCWLLEEIMDEENWEMNAVADGEIIARKLKKLGLLEVKDGYYVRTPMYDALTTEPSDIPISALEVQNCHIKTEPSDLISRAKVLNVVQNADDGNIPYEVIKDIIQGLPSVSAERVVRCYDCISFNGDGKECERGVLTAYNGYCSRAKMKGGTE